MVTLVLPLANAVVLFRYGVMSMVVLAAAFKLASLVVVIVTLPALVVTMDKTYFVGALAAVPAVFTSQPQALAAGNTLLEIVCTVSVILVRHAEPAKIASDTLARTV